jgi:MFS family permease
VTIFRLATALFLVQAGFHGFTAALPLALARTGTPEAQIGLIVGSAALVQIPAAIIGGRLVDRFGGVRLFMVGGVAYLAGTLLLLGSGIDGALALLILSRALQGIGGAMTLPSALSLVPRLIDKAREGFGLSVVAAAHSLTMVVLPPLSIVILDASSLDGVAFAIAVFVAAGLVLAWRLPLRPVSIDPAVVAASRRFGITFRRAWAVPLLIVVTYVAHWGAVIAYLPVQAAKTEADIGLYFAADALAIFLMRIPTGWLSDRVPTRTLAATGIVLTAVAMAMLLLPLSTPLFVVSGLLGGAAGAVIISPMLLELSRRSTDADRGSAFALFSASLASAIAIGSIGGAPIVTVFGFSAALALGIGLMGVALALALADRSMRTAPRDRETPVPVVVTDVATAAH